MALWRLRALVTAIGMLVPVCAGAQTTPTAIRIAAASDLQVVLPALVARFEKEGTAAARVTFGASGTFFAQIQNGAPFDVFLSADVDYPRRLEQAGLTDAGTLRSYATGRLVLWTRRDSGIDLRAGLASLVAPRIRRIAVANPEHAPYGRAAVAALRRAGVYEQVRSRLVLGENIAQAAQFAQSGNADVGIIAHSLALGAALRAAGTFVDVPTQLHPPLEQGAVVLASARDKPVARRFVEFLGTSEAVTLLKAAGFEIPQRPGNRGR